MNDNTQPPDSVQPFTVAVPDAVLDDLRRRLENVRWPADFGNEDWRYGAQREYLEELVDYWLESYDWREQERRMNTFANFKTTIDEVPIHFIHERGKGPDPIPLILTHGWPWTFWDFEQVIGPLTDPASHGGDPADSFDVIIPSLPGYGFSTPLRKTGVNFMTTADLWVKLMRDVLGYDRFAAQGGDWGQLVTSQLGHKYPQHLLGIHLNLSLPLDFFAAAMPEESDYAEDEREFFHHTVRRMSRAGSHTQVQSIDPQNLAYGLHDSPVGLLAWLVDRRRFWSDSNGDVESRFSKDSLITTTMLYWVEESLVTSLRFYYEAAHQPWEPVDDGSRPVVKAPTAMAVFPQELVIMPRRWMEDYFDLQQLTYMESGGHFAPAEEPEALVDDLRRFFTRFR